MSERESVAVGLEGVFSEGRSLVLGSLVLLPPNRNGRHGKCRSSNFTVLSLPPTTPGCRVSRRRRALSTHSYRTGSLPPPRPP